MDFDLFDIEDDDLISSICMLPVTSEHFETSPNILFPEFHCNGEDSLANLSFSNETFVKNSIILNFEHNDTTNCQENIELSYYKFTKSSLYSEMSLCYLFNKARMDIQQLIVSMKNHNDMNLTSYYEARRQVTLLLHIIRQSKEHLCWQNIDKYLKSLRNLLNRIGNQDLFKLIFQGVSIKGNETESPIYHVLHGYFEWRLLDLIILKNQNSTDDVNKLFRNGYVRMIEDLLQISICLFQKKNLTDLLDLSPFPCLCIKECWLLLQVISEQTPTENDCSFWKYFNGGVEHLKNHSSDISSMNQLNISEFTVWLLKGLVQLQGYKSNGTYVGCSNPRVFENFELLENIIGQYFNNNPPEEQSRILLCLLMPILLNWWPPKVDIPMLLWEHFNKNLNSSFFIAGSAPSNLAVISPNGRGYVEKIRLNLENCKPDLNLSSFSLYTIILGKILSRFFSKNQSNQMQKILGRIFSKFSPAKFLTLNETGIHHLIELFLTLAFCGEFIDIAPKMRDKLLQIHLEKITVNRQLCITKGHIALLILFAENHLNISEYVTKLLEQVNCIKMDLNVLKIIADGIYDIFMQSENFDRGEHLLIDSWLAKFLNGCTQAEQERTLETLHLIFEKINKSNMYQIAASTSCRNQIMIKSLNLHILPFVKQNFVTTFSKWIPKLAADFCISSTTGTIGTTDMTVQFQKNFKFFIESNCCDKQAVLKFLLEILSSDKSNLIGASAIIQIWLKSLVLLTANNEDVVSLTKIVTELPDFQLISNLTDHDLISAKEPLCVFVAAVGSCYDSCNDFQKKCLISDKFNSYLVSFEKWLTDKNEKTEILFRFYSFIAIVIFNCPSIVYARSKITCFFHVAITRFIMPPTVQMGKVPELKLTRIIHKIWPVLVQGIGKLNFKTDQYILKTLTDLIVKWTPHFKISENSKVVARPFINCLNNENDVLSLFVFEKLTSVFLAMQRRQADPNACLVITIFQECIDTISQNEKKLRVFLTATCFTILEHLMMVDEIVPSRNLLLELLKKIIKSSAFFNSKEIKELMIEHLKMITVKHLSYFTFFYFELMTKILNMCPELITAIMEFLSEQIQIVETKRGGGEDNRLRNCMSTLKGAVIAAQSKL